MFIYYPRNLLSSTTLEHSGAIVLRNMTPEQASTSHRPYALLPSMLTTRPSMYLQFYTLQHTVL